MVNGNLRQGEASWQAKAVAVARADRRAREGGKIGKEQGHQGGGKLSHMTQAGIDDRSRYLNDQNDVLLGPGLAGKAR
ncbi:hypothetical protein D8I24_3086 (plasmid) [Cupriavidus necator H850]|uniref:hypothetical protein n=1 Tax=Cupriavidus necator TaxID=106590 RepID=UPI003FA4BF65|nr:hypothetical protein D8I24_3086 [Cupriavidus necator H850]